MLSQQVRYSLPINSRVSGRGLLDGSRDVQDAVLILIYGVTNAATAVFGSFSISPPLLPGTCCEKSGRYSPSRTFKILSAAK